jgi:hypothetical protein
MLWESSRDYHGYCRYRLVGSSHWVLIDNYGVCVVWCWSGYNRAEEFADLESALDAVEQYHASCWEQIDDLTGH